jgi:hypothetical protein
MHRATDERKETKESIDGRALQIGKGFIGAFELYNIENGKNDFYHWYFFFIKLCSGALDEQSH